MTEKAAKLQRLVDAFDEHFQRNKKRPNAAKVQAWFVREVAGWERAMWRKADERIQRRSQERWPED
jgi:hypothetical protein